MDSTNNSPSTSRIVPGGFSVNNDTRCGWTDFSTLPNPGQDHLMEALKKSLTEDQIATIYAGSRLDDYLPEDGLLAQLLGDAYFGKWFHNAGALVLAVVLTFILTKLGAGLFACLTVGGFLATYYQTSTRRLRRNIRDDIQREMTLRQLETDNESVNWMNHFMSRFWLIYEPVLSAQIIGTADAILSENCPSFLDSIRLTTFTLGTKAPHIEFVKTYPRTEPNIVCMDWKVSFTPTDTTDISTRDLQSHVDPKIVLSIRLGKKMIGAGVPVLLEGIAFTGHLRLRIKMFNEFPHIQSVEACFLEKPMFDYILKPIGGEYLGFDINNIPGLQTFVQDQVHSNLGPMMYAPNVFTVDVAAMMSGADLDSANGVLALTIHSGTGLKSSDFLGSLDPYLTIHVGSEKSNELGHTKCIEDNNNPQWNETIFVLLNGPTDNLYLSVKDRNVGRKDAEVGIASIDLKELAETDNFLDGLSLTVLNGGKPAGEIKCDMHYFPVSAEEKLDDGTVVPAAESDTGIMQLMVYECKDLGNGQKVDAYAVITIDGEENVKTSTFKRSANPRWDKKTEVFISDKTNTKLTVTIKESQLHGDSVLGTWQSTLLELEKSLAVGIEWFGLKGIAGKLHLGMKWKPTVMTGFTGGLGHGSYKPPIGVVRAHFYGAQGLKNVETLTGGKSDPYVRVLTGMQVRDQTDYMLDNLDPEWDTALYVPVHSLREDLVFEVMDYNDTSKDKSLGLVDFKLKQIVKETVNEETAQKVYEALEPVDRWMDLTNAQRKPGKGRIHCNVSFYPTLDLAKSAAEVEAMEEKEETAQDTSDQAKDTTLDNSDTPSASERQDKDVHGEDVIYESSDSNVINLSKYTAGVLTVKMHGADIPGNTSKVVAELLVNSYEPQYKTLPQKGSSIEFKETGDAFVKELDFSNVVIQLVKYTQKKEQSIVGHCTLSMAKVLDIVMEQQRAELKAKGDGEEKDDAQLDYGHEFKLLNTDGGTIRLSFNYTPVVQYTLRPEESMENQGNLTVTPVSANHLKSADRNGKSDPYVVFTLNGAKVYKTDVYKKTLNPEFNSKKETFIVPVPRRIGSVLEAVIYDWDQLGDNEELGRGVINFTSDVLESFEAKELEVQLSEGDSILKVRLLWQPQLIKRERQGTSLLGSTTRAFTAVPGHALGAGVSLAGDAVGLGGKMLGTGGRALGNGGKAVFGGVGKFGSGIRGFGSKLGGPPRPSVIQETPPDDDEMTNKNQVETDVSDEVVKPLSPVDGRRSIDTVHSTSNVSTIRHNEAIKVYIIGARGLKDSLDCYVRVKNNNKRSLYKTNHIKKNSTPEWNETFMTNVKPTDKTMEFKVRTKGKLTDHDVGTVTLPMDQPFEGWLPLIEGTGELNIRIDIPSIIQNK
ncbi:C2 domain-containing protein [Chlamydoabsidia padenii]|nr:C2 domain-containing protein [Chlamydoabsidia padenii]